MVAVVKAYYCKQYSRGEWYDIPAKTGPMIKLETFANLREPARVLAERHGVTHPTILNVREGRTYKHVRDEPLVPALDWSPGEYHVWRRYGIPDATARRYVHNSGDFASGVREVGSGERVPRH